MVSLPTSPETPTVYLITETLTDPDTRALVEIGIDALGVGPCDIENLPVGPTLNDADRAQILEFLRDAYNARGAFVIGHAASFFDELPGTYEYRDAASELLGEVGVIQRVPGALNALAPRLAAAVHAANRVLPAKTTEVLIFGAGPDARALAAALSGEMCNARPAKVTLASADASGLNVARKLLGQDIPQHRLELRHVESSSEHDRQLALLPPDSAVVRAVGEHEPDTSLAGSAALFPMGAVIWDMMTTAKESRFLAAAVRQRKAAQLTLSDQTAYAAERGVSVLEAMFGAEANASKLAKLRKAVENRET
ncbi:MAG: hypothetical protein HOJ90_00495 [Alphaproteobacteria bacterium]|nr:hypothetical protein [Alphaproteobacteria bacterium]